MKANFELIKSDNLLKPENKSVTKTQLLSVIIPEEFKENFFIKVEIVDSKYFVLVNSTFDLFFKINSNFFSENILKISKV